MSTTVKLTAQQKRVKGQLESAVRLMNRYTATMRERYYNSVIKFETATFVSRIEALKELFDTNQSQNTKDALDRTIDNLSRTSTNSLKWMTEAQSHFDRKINNVASKLVEFGMMNANRITVENVYSEDSREFSFLIEARNRTSNGGFGSARVETNDLIGTAHARLIWVECTEKASHWRFICTKRTPVNVVTPTITTTENEIVEISANLANKSRKEQVQILIADGNTSATSIATALGANVSYIRRIMSTL